MYQKTYVRKSLHQIFRKPPPFILVAVSPSSAIAYAVTHDMIPMLQISLSLRDITPTSLYICRADLQIQQHDTTQSMYMYTARQSQQLFFRFSGKISGKSNRGKACQTHTQRGERCQHPGPRWHFSACGARTHGCTTLFTVVYA